MRSIDAGAVLAMYQLREGDKNSTAAVKIFSLIVSAYRFSKIHDLAAAWHGERDGEFTAASRNSRFASRRTSTDRFMGIEKHDLRNLWLAVRIAYLFDGIRQKMEEGPRDKRSKI